MLSLSVCFLQDQMALYRGSGLQGFVDSLRADVNSALQAKDVLKSGVTRLFLAAALNALDGNAFGAEVRKTVCRSKVPLMRIKLLCYLMRERQSSQGLDQ